jgi:hypothetical protein
MGIKLGDISPLAGVVSGKGLFGKGFSELGRVMGPLSPMGYVAMKQRDKALKKKKGAAGKPGDAEEVMVMEAGEGMRKGGRVKKMAKGGSTASKRGDGCATKGKTKGRMV